MANQVQEIAIQPNMKDASTQCNDVEEFAILCNPFYLKLSYLVNDEIGKEVLQRILRARPQNFMDLSKTLINAVDSTFEIGYICPDEVMNEYFPDYADEDE